MTGVEERRVAIVTGGATGIGRAVATALAARNVAVVLAGRSEERGRAAAHALAQNGGEASFVRTDVSKEADVRSLVERTVEMYGAVDCLFNNAGIEGPLGPIEVLTESAIDELLGINLKGVLLCMKHVLPHMTGRGGGVIVNTASFVGTTVPFPNGIAYGATKAAVLSMTRSVAAGFADQGVRVYAVCPWITDTPMADRLTGFQPEAKAQFGAMNPSGRIAAPEDVASVVLSLLSGAAGLESGDSVLVDSGGLTQRIQPLSV